MGKGRKGGAADAVIVTLLHSLRVAPLRRTQNVPPIGCVTSALSCALVSSIACDFAQPLGKKSFLDVETRAAVLADSRAAFPPPTSFHPCPVHQFSGELSYHYALQAAN